MSGYISLYSQLIKKAIRGGPHRVAVICMLWTHWLGGIIWLIDCCCTKLYFLCRPHVHFGTHLCKGS